MAYRIGKVTLSNFGPFEAAEVRFDLPGVTIIEGVIEGVPGCTSNGSGKSFLIDAVVWCVYGRCIRPDYTGDKLVRLKSRGGTCVEVELIGDDRKVVIRRYRKHQVFKNQVQMEVDGVDVSRGTDQQTQQVIESQLGMDFLTFCNSVAFGTREDIRSFFTATDTDRKRILETILGLELYAEAEKVARRNMQEAASSLSEQQAAQLQRKSSLESLRSMLEEAEATDRETLERELDEVEQELALWRKKEAKRSKAASVARKKEEEADDAYDDLLIAWKEESAAVYEKIDKLQKQDASVDTDVLAATADVRRAEHGIKEVQDRSGGECPTCGQEIKKAHTAVVLKEYRAQLKAAQSRLDAAQEKQRKAQERMKKLRGSAPVKPERPDDWSEIVEASSAAVQRHSNAKVKVAALEQRVESLQRELKRVKRRKETLESQIEAKQAEVDEAETTIEELQDTVALYEFWTEAFGNRGLKSYLIEAEVPEINKQATRYARQLLGRGASVKLSATTTLKSGASRERLAVDGHIPGYTESYQGASKGQKRRMDLALLLSFRAVVAARSNNAIDQLFADEIFDGLDSAGVGAVVELLQEEAKRGPVVLVTHDDRLRSVGDRIITVRHADGVAQVVDSSVTQSNGKRRELKRVKRSKRAVIDA